ncbi:MAG: hypothetical protein HY294_04570 [Candidatus Rokubacteria bacterium]|nr:hypothetical protein [Candidatus Rokubacteria bacterium]
MSVDLTLLLFWIVGSGLLLWAASLARQPLVTAVVAASTLVRSALAVVLYEISARSLPIFTGLQAGPGFWIFSPDSAYLDQYGRWAAIALRAGLGLPFASGTPDYPVTIALLYRWLGPHPLYPVFLNVWAMGGAVIVTALLARRLWGERGVRLPVLLVAFWPSLLVWSTQILKDALAIFLTLLFFAGHLAFQRAGSWPRRLGWAVALGAVLFVLFRLRFYVAIALLAAAALLWVVTSVRAVVRGTRRDVLAPTGLVAALVLAVALAAAVNPAWLGKVRDPLGVYWRLAAHMLSTGDEPGARELVRAIVSFSGSGQRAPADEALLTDEYLDRLRRGNPPQLQIRDDTEPSAERLFRRGILQRARAGFLGYGAASNLDPDVRLTDMASVLRFLPKALVNAAFTPNPWMTMPAEGRLGALRPLAMLEVAMFAGVLLVAIPSVPRGFRAAPGLMTLVLVYAAVAAAGIGLIVPTVGLLVRLRLAFVIPLCLLADGRWLLDRARVGLARSARAGLA